MSPQNALSNALVREALDLFHVLAFDADQPGRAVAARRVQVAFIEKVGYHWCSGSWHGAHINDWPLEHIIDIALKVKAQTCSFEAANVRHQHEMEVWKDRAELARPQ